MRRRYRRWMACEREYHRCAVVCGGLMWTRPPAGWWKAYQRLGTSLPFQLNAPVNAHRSVRVEEDNTDAGH